MPVAVLKRRLKVLSGRPDRRTIEATGASTAKFFAIHACALPIAASSTWVVFASLAKGCWPTACQSMRFTRASWVEVSMSTMRATR